MLTYVNPGFIPKCYQWYLRIIYIKMSFNDCWPWTVLKNTISINVKTYSYPPPIFYTKQTENNSWHRVVYIFVDIENIAGETHQLSSSFRDHLEILSKVLDQLKISKGFAGPVGRVSTTDPNCDLKCFILHECVLCIFPPYTLVFILLFNCTDWFSLEYMHFFWNGYNYTFYFGWMDA